MVRGQGWVEELFVYPVKGLSAQSLERAVLRPGKGIPDDRRFAFARPDGKYRPGTRAGLSKQEFFALVSDHRLAGLDTHLDTDTDVLTARVAGHDVLKADLSTEEGRDNTLRFFSRVLDLPTGVTPLLAREPGRRFTDAAAAGDGPMGWISLVNLASVRDLESRTGTVVDAMRCGSGRTSSWTACRRGLSRTRSGVSSTWAAYACGPCTEPSAALRPRSIRQSVAATCRW